MKKNPRKHKISIDVNGDFTENVTKTFILTSKLCCEKYQTTSFPNKLCLLCISVCFNTYYTMGRFSRRQTDMFFLFSLEERIWHFRQIVSKGDSLYEVSDPICQ